MNASGIERRVAKLEEMAAPKIAPRPVFRFLDNPDGVTACHAANPDALIIHRVTVSARGAAQ